MLHVFNPEALFQPGVAGQGYFFTPGALFQPWIAGHWHIASALDRWALFQPWGIVSALDRCAGALFQPWGIIPSLDRRALFQPWIASHPFTPRSFSLWGLDYTMGPGLWGSSWLPQ
jgi:hypothetical protein